MITEEQFTAAMERAVEKRGAEWRYPDHHQAPPGFYSGNCPTYQDHEGNPTCLIGAAMHQLGMTLPYAGMGGSASALSVLGGSMSGSVAMAARCAQIHQDHLETWGDAFAVYRAALAIQGSRSFSMFEATDLYERAVSVVTGRAPRPQVPEMTAMTELIKAFNGVGQIATSTTGTITASFASGGIVHKIGQPITFTGAEVTFAFNEVPSSLSVAPFTQPVLHKKEHALTA
jgi:hypothetical protein